MDSTVAVSDSAPVATMRGRQLPGFQLGHEEFDLCVLKVREIMGVLDITDCAADAGYT
jgi:hypothetical protein